LAEALLPHLRARFDPVERTQVAQVLAELKLEASDLPADLKGQAEFARLARVRYLVLGSVTPLGGLTVHARLVDVRSGLVVQTAQASAPTPEALLKQLKWLGTQLLMSDAERLALEQQQAQGVVVQAAAAEAALPPPPAPDAAPPPLVVA